MAMASPQRRRAGGEADCLCARGSRSRRATTTGLGVDHSQTEEILRNSGVPYTFLRNSIYQDFLVGGAAKMVAEGKCVTEIPNELKLRVRDPRGLCRRGRG